MRLLALTPLAPARLADVPVTGGYHGLPGRTLDALGLTLEDFARQAGLAALSSVSSGDLTSLTSLRVGGLRAGWAGLVDGVLVLHDYSYVPGVTVSGRIAASHAVLHVGGGAAADGTLGLAAHSTLTGTLGGEAVVFRRTARPADAIVGDDAQASPRLGPGGRAARAELGDLAGILRRLP